MPNIEHKQDIQPNPLYRIYLTRRGLVVSATTPIIAGFAARATSAQTEVLGISSLEAAKSRLNEKLKNLLQERVFGPSSQGYINNPLGLDPVEVEQYINGEEKYYNSFSVLFNSKAEPAFVMVMGGEHGLKPGLGNIENIFKVVDRLNEIDPEIIDILVNQFGLTAIAGSIPLFETHHNFAASLDPRTGVIYINDNEYQDTNKTGRHSPEGLIALIILESRHIYTSRHTERREGKVNFLVAPDKLDDETGVDKGLWLRNWAETHQSRLSRQEYQQIMDSSQATIEHYTLYPLH